LQNFIIKFIVFIYSILSVNAVITIPLSSVISTETQQVEYIEYLAENPLFIIQKTPEGCLSESLSTLNISRTYLYTDLFNNAFDLHHDSLILVDTLRSRQKYKIQKKTFQNTAFTMHKQFIKTFYQVESESLNA
jgi:hypothetical protein